MSGKVVRVLPVTQYKFSAAFSVIVARRIDVSQYANAALLFRLHETSSWNNGDIIVIKVFNDGFTDEDPTTTFMSSVSALSLSFQGGVDTAPELSFDSTSSVGSSVTIIVEGTYGQVQETDIKVSADLVLKD